MSARAWITLVAVCVGALFVAGAGCAGCMGLAVRTFRGAAGV